MKELQRKRHSASPGVSFKGRVRKAAKWKPASDGESDEESESKFLEMDSDRFVLLVLMNLSYAFCPVPYGFGKKLLFPSSLVL